MNHPKFQKLEYIKQIAINQQEIQEMEDGEEQEPGTAQLPICNQKIEGSKTINSSSKFIQQSQAIQSNFLGVLDSESLKIPLQNSMNLDIRVNTYDDDEMRDFTRGDDKHIDLTKLRKYI
ncbi:hypothetical protein pb186bvf_008461 [Paramecium bursaria]